MDDPVLPAGFPDPMNRDYYANPNNIQGISDEQAARLINPQAAAAAMAREAAGESNRIISMSVYGSDPEYWLGAVDNARLVKDHWAQDGWRLRLYHDDQVPQVAIHLIRSLGAETILMRQRTVRDFSGNLWRFLPLITDPTMTRLILRDVDGRLTHRDLEATREWVASEKPFHVMRDNHQHAWPVMAGMWGVVGGFLNASMLEEPLGINPPRVGYFGDDQTILREVVWPHVTRYTLGHDSYTCEQFGLLHGGEYKPKQLAWSALLNIPDALQRPTRSNPRSEASPRSASTAPTLLATRIAQKTR